MFIRIDGIENIVNDKKRDFVYKNVNKYSIYSQNSNKKCGYILDEYLLNKYNDDLYVSACMNLYNIINIEKVKTDTLIVVLHGWGASGEIYSGVIEELSKFGLVLTPDFHGFGKSGELEFSLTIFDYAESVLNLIRLFEFNNIIFFAHSFGARVLFDIFKNASEHNAEWLVLKISKVILTGAAGIKTRFNLVKYLKIKRYKYLKKKCKINKRYYKKLSKYGSNDYKNLKYDNIRKTFLNAIYSVYDDYISRIVCECLIIHGGKDTETPLYMAKRIKRKIKNSSLVVIKNVGHFAFLDSPSEFNNYIYSFLSST